MLGTVFHWTPIGHCCTPTNSFQPKCFWESAGHCDLTKFDALITEAFTQLRDEGFSRKEAKDSQIEQAQKMLNENVIQPLRAVREPPADFVRLDDMRAPASNCYELIEKTANALSDDTLQLLFVSVQQNNIDLCMRHVVDEVLKLRGIRGILGIQDIVLNSLKWFPHVWAKHQTLPELCECASAHLLENLVPSF
ncbi:hypothetical protein B0H14DRAFT_348680 [Mycena olivaceomarginata]|nr:hypothetical protein B0H14DRAFT_348680 [Mycena olivaceomarginata]